MWDEYFKIIYRNLRNIVNSSNEENNKIALIWTTLNLSRNVSASLYPRNSAELRIYAQAGKLPSGARLRLGLIFGTSAKIYVYSLTLYAICRFEFKLEPPGDVVRSDIATRRPSVKSKQGFRVLLNLTAKRRLESELANLKLHFWHFVTIIVVA